MVFSFSFSRLVVTAVLQQRYCLGVVEAVWQVVRDDATLTSM